jgi:predicted GH43/DUF377 family glycosyl hydrolase
VWHCRSRFSAAAPAHLLKEAGRAPPARAPTTSATRRAATWRGTSASARRRRAATCAPGRAPLCFAASWHYSDQLPHYTCFLKGKGATPQHSPNTTSCNCSGAHPPPPVCPNASLPRQSQYAVSVAERSVAKGGGSLISHANGTSVFQYAFNTAAFPRASEADSEGGSGSRAGLVVRVQDEVLHPEWANAGAIAVVGVSLSADGRTMTPGNVTQAAVVWAGVTAPTVNEVWGAIDPRIAYYPATGLCEPPCRLVTLRSLVSATLLTLFGHVCSDALLGAPIDYLTWDNCTRDCDFRQTMLSTSPTPFVHSSWTWHGILLPGQSITAGISLLFCDGGHWCAGSSSSVDATGWRPAANKHLAFVGNSNTADVLLLAESTDGLTWALPPNKTRQTFMAGRPDCWDAGGVAAGPQPERLSSGDWLYIYNIDTRSYMLPLGRCAVGWAILDRNDPSVIVARSDAPVLASSLPFELKGQTPMVIFADGLIPLGGDEFIVTYGAADADVGAAKIRVSYTPAD